MDSVVIISDYLRERAEEHQAVERGIIKSWNDISEDTIDEDLIILDTKMRLTEDKNGSKTVAGVETFQLLDFFGMRAPNIIEKGKTIVGLCSEVQTIYPRTNRTYLGNNYRWLSYFGTCNESQEFDLERDFVYNIPDMSSVQISNTKDFFNSYFLNVARTSVGIIPENSNIVDYEPIGNFEEQPFDHVEVPALAVKSWRNGEDQVINPDGSLVLLPRPDKLRVDIESWFRSLLQIGNYYSPEGTEIDQFNRILQRSSSPSLDRVYKLCNRFPDVARQLENRYASRDTITVEDEYDVQDLLHALLKIFFDDVRAEEWAPSYGGSSPRIDFLLKNETIAIEVKITRKGRGNKEIKQELSEDKEHYRSHPDCDTLICYVYDPVYEFDNPAGFENDLTEQTDNLKTEVLISSTSRYGSV